jgi:anti-anti-sigma factor
MPLRSALWNLSRLPRNASAFMQQESMRVTIQKPAGSSPRPGSVVVKITGEIGLNAMVGPDGKHTGVDGDTALDIALQNALPEPSSLVVVDLDSVTYLSSLGMGALLRLQKRIKDAGGDFRLAGTSEMVVALLRRCRLDHAFSLYPDVASALK